MLPGSDPLRFRKKLFYSYPDKAKEISVAFKNNAPFINCISKSMVYKIDDAEDLVAVISMFNLLEYSKNHRKTTGRLWIYYRDEPSIPPLNKRQVLQKILIILVLVKMVMMQTKLVKIKLKMLSR